jgi:hypothetical protein
MGFHVTATGAEMARKTITTAEAPIDTLPQGGILLLHSTVREDVDGVEIAEIVHEVREHGKQNCDHPVAGNAIR